MLKLPEKKHTIKSTCLAVTRDHCKTDLNLTHNMQQIHSKLYAMKNMLFPDRFPPHKWYTSVEESVIKRLKCNLRDGKGSELSENINLRAAIRKFSHSIALSVLELCFVAFLKFEFLSRLCCAFLWTIASFALCFG